MVTLILGGSGSGKSAYAEDYLLRMAADKKKYYIATMQVWDAEMQAKVDRHHRPWNSPRHWSRQLHKWNRGEPHCWSVCRI